MPQGVGKCVGYSCPGILVIKEVVWKQLLFESQREKCSSLHSGKGSQPVGIPGVGQGFTLQQEQDVPPLFIPFLPCALFTSSSPAFVWFVGFFLP